MDSFTSFRDQLHKIMKNMLLAFILGTLPAVLFAQAENYSDDKGFKQGHWEYIDIDTTEKYALHVHHPGSGSLRMDADSKTNAPDKAYLVNHRYIASGNYTNGKKNGVWILYQDDTDIDHQHTKKEVIEKGGKLIEYLHLFQQKNKKYEIAFENGVKSGPLKTYDAQGNLMSVMHFNNGQPSGKLTTYHANGQKMFEGTLNKNTGFYEGFELYATGSERGSKKIHVDYVLNNFTDISEIKTVLSIENTDIQALF